MAKFKMIQLPSGKLYLYPRGKLLLYQYRVVPKNEARQNARDRNTEAVEQDALLLKEMEEINSWARLGFQMYFGWFALQFTVNAVAMSWLFTLAGPRPAYARLVFGIFIGWNLMGTIMTLYIRKHLLDSDLRIKKMVETLTQNRLSEGYWSNPRSPMPRQAINYVFAFCALTMFMSLVFWTVLGVWPSILSPSE